MNRTLRRLRSSEKGTVAIELALVIVGFFILIVAVVDFALGLWIWNGMQFATQEGARYALINLQAQTPGPSCPSSVYSAQPNNWQTLCTTYQVQQLVDGIGPTPADFTVTITNVPSFVPPFVPVTNIAVSYTYNFIVAAFIGIPPLALTTTASIPQPPPS